ncbi:MAG: ankyrin repeat domain-containing protein, partial [Paracoccaceae bacterium]
MKFRTGAVTIAAVILGAAAFAQTPPSVQEIAIYQGLHAAAHLGDSDAIHQLLDAGADVNLRDRAGRSPTHIATYASNDAALRVLAQSGADMNALENRAYDVLTIASVANDVDMVKLAIALGNRADLITSPFRGTAPVSAAHLGHFKVIDLLISAGAPLDHVNNLNWTALIEAVILGDGGADHTATVRLLVKAGANVDIADANGLTPLNHAAALGYG